MPCSYCGWAGIIGRRGAEKGIVKGLCKNCYYRQKRFGTLERQKVRHPCTAQGCDRLSVAQGLCDLHYRRWKVHGKLETDLSMRGPRESHPLYGPWTWMTRKAVVCEEWRSDFWKFVDHAKERPSDVHRVNRPNKDAPYGPTNFEWEETNFQLIDEGAQDYRKRYMREYREKHPERMRSADLKKNFGIDANEYDRMLALQNGVCAICGSLNVAKDHRTGIPRRLSVDHCHTTGKIRKLLCQHCNQGLGNFRDDPVLIQKAIEYLKEHQL